MRSTDIFGQSLLALSASSMPSMPGMTMSEMSRSKGSPPSLASASRPSSAVTTRCPRCCNARATNSRTARSSSAIKISAKRCSCAALSRPKLNRRSRARAPATLSLVGGREGNGYPGRRRGGILEFRGEAGRLAWLQLGCRCAEGPLLQVVLLRVAKRPAQGRHLPHSLRDVRDLAFDHEHLRAILHDALGGDVAHLEPVAGRYG